MTRKLYEFIQNNSGGVFDVDDKVCHIVYIEAESAEEANRKAVELGIYFNGVEGGYDCDCCGDRWYEATRPAMEGMWGFKPPITTAEKFNNDIEKYAQYLANQYGWTTPDSRIFYSDGTVTEIFEEAK